MRIATYNLQSGLGMDGVRDVLRAGMLLRDLGVDLAGLQEVEMGSPRSRFENQPVKLSRSSGLEVTFQFGFKRGPWRFGNAFLSRFPIRSSRRVALPSSGEQRSALVAEVSLPPTESTRMGSLNLVVTHLGLNEAERLEQAHSVVSLLGELEGPVVLMGDFNAVPDSPPIRMLIDQAGLVDISGNEPTYPASHPTSSIDFIFVRGLCQISDPRVIQSLYSDHLPVVIDVEVDD